MKRSLPDVRSVLWLSHTLFTALILSLGLWSCDSESTSSVNSRDMVAGAAGDLAGVEQAGAEQAGAEQAGAEQAGAEQAGAEQADAEQAGAEQAGDTSQVIIGVEVQSPSEGQSALEARELGFNAIVNVGPVELASFVSWELTSSLGGSFPILFSREDATLTADLSTLENRDQTLNLIARVAPNFEQTLSVSIIAECDRQIEFDQPLSPEEWRLKGSASYDERGWLEMTGRQTYTSGAIFYTGVVFNPGDLDVRFKIAAGACDEVGTCSGQEISDGYAMTVWNVSPAGIDVLWDQLLSGGGTGASISDARLANSGFLQRPEGFTIEFDTYPNSCPPNGFWDPVQQPHVQLNMDGNLTMGSEGLTPEEVCMLSEPGANYPGYWSPTPSLTDNQWHEVHVTIQGTRVQVTLDGANVIDTQVPDFEFKGGLLTFSGGSGAVPAFQRFDDLRIRRACP